MSQRLAPDRPLPLGPPSLSSSYWKRKLAPQWRKNRLENERRRKQLEARESAPANERD